MSDEIQRGGNDFLREYRDRAPSQGPGTDLILSP